MPRLLLTAVLALGCGAAERPTRPAPPPAAEDGSPGRIERPEPVEPPPEQLAAPPAALSLLASDEPMWWLVPIEGAETECRPFRVQRADTEGHGWLRPARGGSQDDPWAVVTYRYEVREETLVVKGASARFTPSSGAGAICEQAVPLAELPWFASAEACERARGDDRSPLALGACAEGAASLVRARPRGSEPLTERLSEGGRVFVLSEEEPPRCRAWRVVPSGDGEGSLQRTRGGGRRQVRESLGYVLDGPTISLLGPATEEIVDGRVVSGTAVGYGETRDVEDAEDGSIRVGGEAWFLGRADCEHARRELR